MENKENCPNIDIKVWGTVTVGPKGQVVIPKEIRDILHLSPGDTMITITKGKNVVGFIKNENLTQIMEYLKSEMNSQNI